LPSRSRLACHQNLDARETLLERCRNIAEIYRLSPREYEVLVLLAKGRSHGYIQNELCIAHGTIKAHVRHIYEKLQITSRQELLDLVEKGEG